MEKLSLEDLTQDSKETLLRKCRDTIEKMESEILIERSERAELEKQNKDLFSEYLYLKKAYEEVLLKSKPKFELDGNGKSNLQHRFAELKGENQRLEQIAMKEKEKAEIAQVELEKYAEFISELQEELKNKQETLEEWNEAVCVVEKKNLRLSEENDSLKYQLENYNKSCNESCASTKSEAMKSAIFEDFKFKITQVLGIENSINNEELIYLIDCDRKFIENANKEKAQLNATLKNLNEKQENIKGFYDKKVARSKEKNKIIKADLFKCKQELQEIDKTVTRKNEKITSLKSLLDASGQCANKVTQLELDLQKSNEKVKIIKQELKTKDSIIKEKSEIIAFTTDRLNSIEESSKKELDFLKNGLESLKECFRLEISKKEQEIMLRFQNSSSSTRQREQELLEEIQRLQDEISKIKSHYSQILNYKEEEKVILEQDRVKLKSTVKGLELKIEDLSTSADLSQSKTCIAEYSRALNENSRSPYDRSKKRHIENTEVYHKSEDDEYYQALLNKKEKELKEFKYKFEERLRMKVSKTQERISAWKSQIREDLYCLKRSLSQSTEKSFGIIQKIEKTLSAII